MELTTGMHVDRFVVETTLGRGGMATVLRVRHRALGTTHALKVLHLSHPSLRERLLEEGRVQARLGHPNVVSVTDVLDLDGQPGLLMEYVHGPTLEDLLLAHGRLPISVIERIVPGILAGVATAHAAQVVHRDLKPANILLEVRGGRIVPKVADFGLVKVLDDESARTMSGVAMGTPNYMAPEQIRNARAVDARSDIFALGAILYELVGGQRAFANSNPLAVVVDIAEGNFPPLRSLAPEAPTRWVEAIEAAMATQPDRRPESCEGLWQTWRRVPGSLSQAAQRTAAWDPEWLDRVRGLCPPLESEQNAVSGTPVTTSSSSASASQRSTFNPWGFVVMGVMLVGGLMVLWASQGRVPSRLEPEVEPTPTPAGASSSAPEHPTRSVPSPEPTDDVPSRSLSLPAPPPPPALAPTKERRAQAAPVRSAAQPEPSESTPTPQEDAVLTGAVVLSGDADVRLLDDNGDPVPLHAVPPGRYRIQARYGTGDWNPEGHVDVQEGQTVAVTCRSAIRNCMW